MPKWRYLTPEEAALELKAGNNNVKNTIIDEESGEVDIAASPKTDVGMGMAGRQIASQILPQLGGRAAGALAGSPFGPIGMIIGGVLGGMGTQYTQDKILNKLADKDPTSAIADFQRKREGDLQEHPYVSAILGLPSAIAGGGGPGISSLKNAAKIGGASAGIDAVIQGGSQIAQGQDVDIDPIRSIIAGAGGATFSRPISGIAAAERNVLKSFGAPQKFIDNFAPSPNISSALDASVIERNAAKAGGSPETINNRTLPIHLQPGYNPDYYASAPIEELQAIKTPLTEQIIRLKKANVPLSADDIDRLAKSGNRLNDTASDILLDKFQRLSGNKPQDRTVELAEAVPGKSAEDAAPIQTARQSAEDIQAAQKTPVEPEIKKKVDDIATPPKDETRSMGLAPDVIAPIKEKISRTLRPGLTRIASTLGKIGERFKKKYEEASVTQKQLNEPYQDAINKIRRTLTPKQEDRIKTYLNERFNTGKSSIVLDAEEQAGVKLYDEIIRLTAIERSRPDSPLVSAIDPVTGNTIKRPFSPIPNYFPNTPSDDFWETIRRGSNTQKAKDYHDAFINHHISRGIKPDVAERIWGEYTTMDPGLASSDPISVQVRRAEGVGLPIELQANPFDSLQKMVENQAVDLAWHRTLESDPELGPLLGLKEDGRGNVYPTIDPVLGRNEDVAAALRDFTGGHLPHAQKFEGLDRLVKTLLIQTPSQIWNIAQSGPAFGEFVRPGEIKEVIKGLVRAFTTDAQIKAIQRGSIRASRNLNPATASGVNDILNRTADFIQGITGTEKLEQIHRAWFDTVAKIVSDNRLRDGDIKFFDQFGPADWQSWDANKLTDYTAARITKKAAGGYDAEELPNWLLRGSASPWKPIFTLARWSVGRSNNFVDNVIKPAKNGNILPLLGSLTGGVLSAGTLNYIKEELTGRKPKELTWEEYFKLGGGDTAYTILSKANTASYAGFLGMAAYSAAALYHGESIRGIANPTFQAASETGERIMQTIEAVKSGNVSLPDAISTMSKQIMMDRIQLLRTFLDTPPEEGNREEKIARRLGLTPEKSTLSGGMFNPLSAQDAYRKGDSELLQGFVDNAMKKGKQVPTPRLRQRSEGGLDVLRRLQGSNAVTSALEMDNVENARRVDMLDRALRNSR